MRITDAQLFNNFVRAFGDNRNRVSAALEQLADGKRVRIASDDPAAARSAIQLRGRAARLEGYTSTADRSIRPDLSTIENALGAAFDLLLDARTEAELGASGTAEDFGDSIADKVDKLREQLLHLANTRQGDRYLFGGTETLTEPFDAAGVYQGNTAEAQGPLDESIDVGVTVAGNSAFQGGGDVFATLSDLSTALRAKDSTAIQGLLTELSSELDNLLQVRADVGNRLNLVDNVVRRHEDESLRLSIRIIEIESIDLERAAVDLAAANTSNEALSTAASRVLGRSLFDFLG